MNELITIKTNENHEACVSGRELHAFLQVDSNYTTWFERMTEYGFETEKDFIPFLEESTGGRPKQDHIIKLDMAKELSMIQRTEKGKQARQYFIAVEKEYNSPEKIMARALLLADKEIKAVKLQLQAQAPKVIFADAVSASKTSILVGELAKLLKQNGINMGQNRLFDWLRINGFLIRRKGTDYNMPTQTSMEMGLFEIKETSITHSDGHISVSKTPKVTGKGQVYFINKFLKKEEEELEEA